MINWIYLGKEVNSIDDLPENAIGFVYIIHLSNGRKYIGKKNLYSERKVSLGKKELVKITDKRLKTYKIVKKESDWKKYNSSNKEIKEKIKSGEIHVTFRKIIDVAYSVKELTYREFEQLVINQVLEKEEYYNDNILGKFYRKDLIRI